MHWNSEVHCRIQTGSRLLRTGAFVALALGLTLTCSCTLLTASPYLVRETTVPILRAGEALLCSSDGAIPYQKWRVPPWDDNLRYVWMVGDYDFRRFRNVELILYFHGMHSKDYYRAFHRQLEELAKKRPHKPFLFVGFVDTPYILGRSRSRNRWKFLSPHDGQPPERLFRTVNRIFKALRRRFPNIRKDRTSITLAGFSGGGRVLDAVGNWLAQSSRDDPFARVFRRRLGKIAYFDCWFDKDILETVPALLEGNPTMKIVSTVHMRGPTKHAKMLADRLKLKKRKPTNALVGMGGRVRIYQDTSHWRAMISRLKEAL
jgi:hypothetical protein